LSTLTLKNLLSANTLKGIKDAKTREVRP
jgi:hypothetical protein